MNFRNISIILQREYIQRVRKRAFILTTILTPLLIIAISVLPTIIMTMTKDSSSSLLNIAVVDKSEIIAPKLEDNNIVKYTKDL